MLQKYKKFSLTLALLIGVLQPLAMFSMHTWNMTEKEMNDFKFNHTYEYNSSDSDDEKKAESTASNPNNNPSRIKRGLSFALKLGLIGGLGYAGYKGSQTELGKTIISKAKELTSNVWENYGRDLTLATWEKFKNTSTATKLGLGYAGVAGYHLTSRKKSRLAKAITLGVPAGYALYKTPTMVKYLAPKAWNATTYMTSKTFNASMYLAAKTFNASAYVASKTWNFATSPLTLTAVGLGVASKLAYEIYQADQDRNGDFYEACRLMDNIQPTTTTDSNGNVSVKPCGIYEYELNKIKGILNKYNYSDFRKDHILESPMKKYWGLKSVGSDRYLLHQARNSQNKNIQNFIEGLYTDNNISIK